MKKQLLLIAAALIVLLPSCEKTYQCECVVKVDGVEQLRSVDLMKGKRSDVEKQCLNGPGAQSSGNVEAICVLK